MPAAAIHPGRRGAWPPVCVLAASLLPILLAPYPPLQDLPDWSYQARIWSGLSEPASPFATLYARVGLPVPNSAVTVLLAAMRPWLGDVGAARALAVLAAVLFAAAYVRFVRSWRRDYAPTAELVGAFFAVGHFFWMGYLNFQLGAAVFFIALSWQVDALGSPIPRRFLRTMLALVAAYFCHFLAWTALLVALAGIVWSRHGRDAVAYRRLAACAAPSLLLLAWYALGRSDGWHVGYAYANPLKWLWYKAAPFTFATGFYPVTPKWVQWLVAIVNLKAGLVLAAAVITSAWSLRRLRHPLAAVVVVFLVVGLIGPTRFYEVVRPGERWLFLAVLTIIAVSPRPRWSSPPGRAFVAFLILVSAANGVGAYLAGRETRRLIDDMESASGRSAAILNVADSHFHFRETRSWADKAVDPYSYPNWVNSLKFAPYWYNVRHGGDAPNIFPSGLVRVRDHRYPSNHLLRTLGDPAVVSLFDLLVASGMPDNIDVIRNAAEPVFTGPRLQHRHTLVMSRDKRSQ